MTGFHVYAAADGAVDDVKLRKITTADVFDALRLGWDDFAEKPSHYVFMCLIYPILGFILLTWARGGNLLQLIYPLLAGFALLGPFFALGLYEISRRRETHDDTSWKHALEVLRSPALPSILAVGAMLLALFLVWLYTAYAIYAWIYGPEQPASLPSFLIDVISTSRGWTLILVGNAVGFLFALVALATTAIAFPLLLRRDVGALNAVKYSLQAFFLNPVPMLLWGLIVSLALVVGTIPALVGLAVVLPVLGHSTWHLYRKIVEARASSAMPAPRGATAVG
jgi:uncharacterized membrane protein